MAGSVKTRQEVLDHMRDGWTLRYVYGAGRCAWLQRDTAVKTIPMLVINAMMAEYVVTLAGVRAGVQIYKEVKQ